MWHIITPSRQELWGNGCHQEASDSTYTVYVHSTLCPAASRGKQLLFCGWISSRELNNKTLRCIQSLPWPQDVLGTPGGLKNRDVQSFCSCSLSPPLSKPGSGWLLLVHYADSFLPLFLSHIHCCYTSSSRVLPNWVSLQSTSERD